MASRGCQWPKESWGIGSTCPAILQAMDTTPNANLLKPSSPGPDISQIPVLWGKRKQPRTSKCIQQASWKQNQQNTLQGCSQASKGQAETVTHIGLYQRTAQTAQVPQNKGPDTAASKQNPVCSTKVDSKILNFYLFLCWFIFIWCRFPSSFLSFFGLILTNCYLLF